MNPKISDKVRLGASGAVVTGVLLAAALMPSAAPATTLPQTKYGVQFSPHTGGRRTTFTASFTAPFKANGSNTLYYLEAFGPPDCADASHFTDAVSKGQKVTLSLRPIDMDLPRSGAHRWCHGSYIANLVYQAPGDRPSVLMGNFKFRVR